MSEAHVDPIPQTATPASVSSLPRWRVAILSMLAVVVGIFSLAAIVGILRVHFSGEKKVVAHETHEPEHASAEHVKGHAFSYEVTKMGIALSDRRGRAGGFAQFSLVFDCPNAEAKRRMEVSRSLVRDAVYEAAADFRVENFNHRDGLSLFKERILEVLDTRLQEDTPRAVSIEDWVFQPAM